MSGTDELAWRLGIGPARSLELVGMPLLAEAADRLGPGALSGVTVLYVNHLISDALMAARAFKRLGASLATVTIPYAGVHGPVQQATCEAFGYLGPTWLPDIPHPTQFPSAMAQAVRQAVAAVAEQATRDGRGWLVVEDGGYAVPALHDDPALRPYLAGCAGGVEHTTRGMLNDRYQELDGVPRTPRRLDLPVVTIAGSRLKTAHEGAFVAQALVDECGLLLRRHHQFLRYRPVAVLGYGRIGRALARALASVGAEVLVVDPTVGQPGGPSVDLAHQLTTLDGALASGAFLLFGATGLPSVTGEHLASFLRADHGQPVLYLASASSKAIEFSEVVAFFQQLTDEPGLLRRLTGRDGRITAEVDPAVGLGWQVAFTSGQARSVVLLGCGYPVLFFPPDSHGAANRAMDPVMTQLFLAACGLASAHGQLQPRLHTVQELRGLPALPDAWAALVDEPELLRRWCQLNDLDPDRYLRQLGYLAADQPPTPTAPNHPATSAGGAAPP